MKIFALGTTGYIGGDAFSTIAKAHPEHEWTCLVRNSQKGAVVAAEYPKAKLVYGDLDSLDLIEEEARKADVVCNWANADHEAAATAILKGLVSKGTPGYLIHTSGTGILLFNDVDRKTYGEANSKIYDDWDNIKEVTSLPDHAPHRTVDKIVLEAGTKDAGIVKTAIVCPPTIYGPGRGPGNKRSHQVPELARATLEQGRGIKVGAGETYWHEVHVHDLSQLYLKLVEAAAKGGEPATWGSEGYYFCERSEFHWGDVSQWIATDAHKKGLIQDDIVHSMSQEEADKCTGWGSALWGANSRARATRARKLLGWECTAPSLQEDVSRAVDEEAKALSKIPGHAKVAAGEA